MKKNSQVTDASSAYTEALHWIELAHLRQRQDQRFLSRAFDPDLVALLDDGEPFARLEPKFLLALVHPVFEQRRPRFP